MEKRQRGRPTRFSSDVADRVLLAVRNGADMETAAAFAGTCGRTVRRWAERGERGEEPFAWFSSALKKARAVAELRDLMRVRVAADRGVWQASAWILERRWPQRWARVRRVAARHGGNVGSVDQWR